MVAKSQARRPAQLQSQPVRKSVPAVAAKPVAKAAVKPAPIAPVVELEKKPTTIDLIKSFSFDDLPEPMEAEYTRPSGSWDSEAETPAAIKRAVIVCFSEGLGDYEGEYADFVGEFKAVWMIQPCGTVERAQAFIEIARKYAKFRGWTFRGPREAGTTDIRYSVRPFESRARKAK